MLYYLGREPASMRRGQLPYTVLLKQEQKYNKYLQQIHVKKTDRLNVWPSSTGCLKSLYDPTLLLHLTSLLPIWVLWPYSWFWVWRADGTVLNHSGSRRSQTVKFICGSRMCLLFYDGSVTAVEPGRDDVTAVSCFRLTLCLNTAPLISCLNNWKVCPASTVWGGGSFHIVSVFNKSTHQPVLCNKHL